MKLGQWRNLTKVGHHQIEQKPIIYLAKGIQI